MSAPAMGQRLADLAQAPYPTAALVGPDGRFYPTYHGGHTALAERLMPLAYGREGDDEELGKRGWLKVYSDGYATMLAWRGVPTQAQLDTLADLAEPAPLPFDPDAAFKANLRHCLEALIWDRERVSG